MLGWGLFLGDLIPLGGCEKRECEKTLVAQLCCLPSNIGFPYTNNGLVFLRCTGTVVPWCSSKFLFLKFSKTSQETPALESFFIKLQALRPATLLKRNSSTGVFEWIFFKFSTFFYSITLVVASINYYKL